MSLACRRTKAHCRSSQASLCLNASPHGRVAVHSGRSRCPSHSGFIFVLESRECARVPLRLCPSRCANCPANRWLGSVRFHLQAFGGWSVGLELMRICTFSIRESMCFSMCSTKAVVAIRLVKIKPLPFSIGTSQTAVGTPSARNTAVGNVTVGNSAEC